MIHIGFYYSTEFGPRLVTDSNSNKSNIPSAAQNIRITNLFFQCLLTTFRVIKEDDQISVFFGQLSIFLLMKSNLVFSKSYSGQSFLKFILKMMPVVEGFFILV